MRKYISLLFLALFTAITTLSAQNFVATPAQTQPTASQLKIGYFSYDEVLRAMPAYAIVEKTLQDLRNQYETEMQNAEKEFNEKYETFLENQHTMARAIREKRQSELQNMLERNVAFKQEAERLMAKAEEDALRPLHEKIAKALNTIALERAYIVVLNTDSNACPYINPIMAEDITTFLLDALK